MRDCCDVCGVNGVGARIHNAQPIVIGMCCQNCNYRIVIPKRLENMLKYKRKVKKW